MPVRRSFLPCVALAALGCHTIDPGTGPGTAGAPEFASAQEQGVVLSRVDLGTLGGPTSYATDINNAREVVGWSVTSGGFTRAFRWKAGTGLVDLGVLPGDEWSRAYSVTNDGQVLGESGVHGAFRGRTVVWSPDGSISPLPIPLLPNAEFGEPGDLAAGQQVVGWDAIGNQHAWYWSHGTGKIDITAAAGSFEGSAAELTNSGYVTGTNKSTGCRFVPECWHAFLWSVRGGYRDLGIPGTDPNITLVGSGLNGSRTVVGWVSLPDRGLRPYRWSEKGGFTILPATDYSYAVSVNGRGTAVGAAYDPVDDAIQAAAWPSAGGAVELQPDDPFPAVAVAINDNGAIAGWRSLNCCGGQNHAMLWVLGRGMPNTTFAQDTSGNDRPRQFDQSGIDECLADPTAAMSRLALVNCVATRDRGSATPEEEGFDQPARPNALHLGL